MYVGEWKLKNGRKVKHGQGKLTFPGAVIQNTNFGQEEYEGMWEDDKMHGQGRYTFTSGAEYNGQWCDGKMNGFGKMVYADGTSYEGTWEENLMHGEGCYVDADGVQWTGIFVNGSFESKIQKKLKADKELLDRIEDYRSKAVVFVNAFIEIFGKSDKKTFKDNLGGFFATADNCLDYVQEPYTKYEERLPDKWNEIFKAIQENGEIRVLATVLESTVLDPSMILVEQIRSKVGGQIIEIDCTVAEKVIQVVLCELPSEQWTIVKVEDKA